MTETNKITFNLHHEHNLSFLYSSATRNHMIALAAKLHIIIDCKPFFYVPFIVCNCNIGRTMRERPLFMKYCNSFHRRNLEVYIEMIIFSSVLGSTTAFTPAVLC
jgi:hypothetical protein